jgi:alcohol/geraniol dehydrogenase (NADP+)
MSTITGFACNNPKEDLRPFSYEAKPLAAHEVALQITHCSICHSDIHLIDNDWQVSRYPFIPGHEIVGTITALGDDVKHLQVDQRVGIGWQRSSCHRCDQCVARNEHFCMRQQATCVGNHGGFADGIAAIDSAFAIPIPDYISSAHAAPLLCGGITVFSPLKVHGVTTGTKVGVVGIGGLGHLALQFATAMGAEVTALSGTASKATEAASFGASHFIDLNDATAMRKATSSLDVILYTASGAVALSKMLALLRPHGKVCVISGSTDLMQATPNEFLMGEKSVVGSMIGPPARIAEMLEFAARHNVLPQIESMPLAQVNDALAKVRNNQARYRMVLEVSGKAT